MTDSLDPGFPNGHAFPDIRGLTHESLDLTRPAGFGIGSPIDRHHVSSETGYRGPAGKGREHIDVEEGRWEPKAIRRSTSRSVPDPDRPARGRGLSTHRLDL